MVGIPSELHYALLALLLHKFNVSDISIADGKKLNYLSFSLSYLIIL